MRTPATSGSIRRIRSIRASSRSTSASWARCPSRTSIWLAENFLALFNRDYRRIAELHVRRRMDAGACARRRARSGRAHGLRAVFHAAAQRDFAGRSRRQIVRDGAAARAHLAAAADSAAENAAEHRGRRAAFASADRYLGDRETGARKDLARTLRVASNVARRSQSASRNGSRRRRKCPS